MSPSAPGDSSKGHFPVTGRGLLSGRVPCPNWCPGGNSMMRETQKWSLLAGAVLIASTLACGGSPPEPASADSALTSTSTGSSHGSGLGRRVRLLAEGMVDLRFVI